MTTSPASTDAAAFAPFVVTTDFVSLLDGRQRFDVLPVSSSKHDLLDWYAKALQFPAYFGHNWDALEECLCDLSWLPTRRLLIAHQTLPLHGKSHRADSRTYLKVLASAVRYWQRDATRELIVAFDPKCRASLQRLLSRGRA
jgi:RNAse (barnase) inhibitor barstar